MVKHKPIALDALFAALADPSRRAMLARLRAGECSVSELARPLAMSLPGVHKHLRVLERAGLLAHAKRGRVRRCRLVAGPLQQAARWIEHYRRYWEHRFDALAAYLETTADEESSWSRPRKRQPSRSASPARSPRRATGSSAPGPSRRR